ncbi:hypothetical protein RIF29_16035 [Crotalaria pallida]|uniref:Beta-glucosidase n=1 Tax=Crotalaria pallida TaxID=3830 RepID=A0AAN9FLM6_CROPI
MCFAIAIVAIFEIQLCMSDISRQSFPKGFVFGTASSSFQYEGAVKEDGRGPSVWDTFSHSHGKISDNSTADVAVDQYHRYEEDIQLMNDIGMDAYRFSISWSRIFPEGSGKINQAGIDHYNKLINALLAKGIQPYVTLYHWDLPQSLEDKYKGWLSPLIIVADIYKQNYKANSLWLYIVPHGIRSTMNYIKQKYGNPLTIITENGMDDPNDPRISITDALKDEKRIRYHSDYLINLLGSIIEDGCNVKGYFVWSLLDNWEWQAGYTSRFGLYFIDYKDNLKRYPKHSAEWFEKILKSTG